MSRNFTPLFVLLLLWSLVAQAGPPETILVRESVLGPTYPLEARISFHAALLHWMDALAGLRGRGGTAGKTDDAHRREFHAVHGEPTELDVTLLRRYAEIRAKFAREAPADRTHALTLAFFDSPSLDAALNRATRSIGDKEVETLRMVMDHFASRFRPIWDDGRVARGFVDGVMHHPRRGAVGALLGDVERFFGVERIDPPHPSIVVMPVPDGFGTHAQALGHALLLEVRTWEDLVDEVSPIVHENAHFLFYRIPQSRRDALGARAARSGPAGPEAWFLLHEALPTAIGQGVAGARFRGKRWSRQGSWYHLADVDRYAKALFPLVRKALAQGRSFDEAFVDQAVALYEPSEGDESRSAPAGSIPR